MSALAAGEIAAGSAGRGKVLVVEDDCALREALCATLSHAGYSASGVGNGSEALDFISADEAVQMVVSDVRMPEMDGATLLKRLNQVRPDLPVLMMTAYGTVDGAVGAMRQGAVNYLQKPVPRAVLLEQVANHLASGHQPAGPAVSFVAVDPASRSLLRLAERVAKTDATVMITGESGTGKEVLAQHIHSFSSRSTGPFVAINCAAIPESMLEATLFGHERGAFTGAHRAAPGKFEQANGGTLLLDEVTEMDVDLQAKLLRVLQEREVERIGGMQTIALDVRVIATTNRNLLDAVRVGVFREDLYYRLNVVPLALKPLRERPLDILPIAEKLLGKHGDDAAMPKSFSEGARNAIRRYDWPGNIRELGNVIQRAVVLCAGQTIDEEDLALDARTSGDGPAPEQAAAAAVSVVANGPGPGDLKALERSAILDTLSRFDGNRAQTAYALGMSDRTLRHKLAKLREKGFDVPPVRRRSANLD